MERVYLWLGLMLLMIVSGCQNKNNEAQTNKELSTETNVMIKVIVGDAVYQATKLIGDEVQTPEYEVPEGQVLIGWFISDEDCENFDRP